MCLALAFTLEAAGPDAKKLYQEGRRAQRAGDVVRAYLLYSEAAAMDPKRPLYWDRAQALRTQAALQAKPRPRLSSAPASLPEPAAPPPEGFSTNISDDDLMEARRLRPPPALKSTPGRKPVNLRGDYKTVFEQTAKVFGLDTVFDADYQPGPQIRFQLQNADYREALHALEAATGSFVIPLGERLFMVAKDTPQKRLELEPTVAVSIPIPNPVTVQEAQEMARAVQQAMEILKFAVDADRHMVLIKDRISKVRPAQLLFEQLAHGRAQVAIQVQVLEVDQSSFLSYGFLMPNQFPILYAGRGSVSGAVQSMAQFLFGHTILGLGIANANLFATMSRSTSKNLMQAEIRSLDGEAATLHVGERYPVQTGGFLGTASGIPPAFNYEDLGLSLKVTPHVHGMDEVSLDVDAEFKMLVAGQSFNGIPVISNRKMQSKVRLQMGEWAVIAGMMSADEATAISGTAGLLQLPLLGRLIRQNNRNQDSTQVLVVLKPTLLNLPPGESLTWALWIGSDGRLRIPL